MRVAAMKSRRKRPPAQCLTQRSKHKDRRCSVETNMWERGAQTLAIREGAGDGQEMWKKDEGQWERSERCRSLYLEKAAGGAMHGALPEGAAPNPTGPRLDWKRERAALSPSPLL